MRLPRPNGIIAHAEIQIGDARIMLAYRASRGEREEV